jgi:hypothetical protein
MVGTLNMETTFAVLSDIHLGSDEPKNTHKMFHCKTVREIAKAELLTRGTSEAGLKVTEGDASDRWAMLELRELARMMVLS